MGGKFFEKYIFKWFNRVSARLIFSLASVSGGMRHNLIEDQLFNTGMRKKNLHLGDRGYLEFSKQEDVRSTITENIQGRGLQTFRYCGDQGYEVCAIEVVPS